MKENDKISDNKFELLLKKNDIKPKTYRKTFPLGFQDKREIGFYKSRKKSKNSSKSGSSESIEEKNEELEDDDINHINEKNNNDNNSDNDKIEKNLKPHSLNDESDSEIVEEEIISEEVIAQIYKNLKENTGQDLKENIISPIIAISESNIVKKDDNINEIQNKNKKINKKEKQIKKKENILFKYFNHKSLIEKLRIITLIILIIYILLGTFSIVLYLSKVDKKIVFCFEFLDNESNEKFFLSDRNSFFLVQVLLFFTFASVINSLIRNEYLQLKQFFKETSIYFPLTLIVNMPIFIVGIVFNKYGEEKDPKIWTSIIFSVLTFFGFFFMGNVLINVKRHKYKSISSLINISVLSSFLAAFECYCFIYCICFLLRSCFIIKGKKKVEEMNVPEIIAGLIYFGIGFFVITAFKDIYFSFIVVTIEIGLLYVRKNYSLTVVCFNILTTFFSFASIVITIFKYKKRVFGLSHVDYNF